MRGSISPRTGRLWLVFLLVPSIWLIGCGAGAAQRLLFSMDDPAGDDDGGGSVVYPLDDAFYPHRELLDLLRFEVWQDDDHLLFEFLLGRISNPWNAPEGFYHPRIDVYISFGGADGGTEPMVEGPGVRFTPRWPWHAWLRVAPFGESALVRWEEGAFAPQREAVAVDVVEGRRLRVRVPASSLPPAQLGWRYYVLVGSFDGLGRDGYRLGAPGPSRWLLGGLEPQDPLVVDLLAPKWGPRSQRAQLRKRGDEAFVLWPVGRGFGLWRFIGYGAGLFLMLLAGAILLGRVGFRWRPLVFRRP